MMMEKSVSPDRISELPDEIINLILGSLPSHEEVARTSILSRRWLNLWLSNSYPVVEFQGRGTEEKRFQSFAAATSKRLQLQAVPFLLDSFTISLQHRPTEEEFYKLLSSASIRTDDDNGGRSSPLKVVLIIDCWMKDFLEAGTLLNCGRTKFLHLRGFDLRELHNFKTCLDNLQELTLENVRVSQQSFPSCLANARRLEKLSLKAISGIERLDISASNFPSLIYLSFESDGHYPGLRELQLSSPPLLQTFRFRGDSKLLTVVSAPNVTSLQLAPCAKPTRNEFDVLISKFPSLESLDFDARHIRHNDPHTLRKLTLTQEKRGRNEFEFEIDAPNLVALFIRSDELPNNFYIILAASSTCQCVVDCSISEAQYSAYWSVNLRECVESLATQFRHIVFNLNFPPQGCLDVLQLDSSKLRWQSYPVAVQHLLLRVDLPNLESAFETAIDQTLLLNGILSAFYPKTLLVAQRGENQSLLSVSPQLPILAYRFF
ncbi:hypothetical protein LINGRAHAP2_LOCUS16860 [Linum grandiflorum]